MAPSKSRPIRLLDDATVDRIAAGEVIERPASVVKELVENALDAGAQSLKVEIDDGGLALIRLEDDGHGIPFRDLPLAFERHATSKISSAADILQIGSFGFRGEALASIAAVSRCEMTTRSSTEEIGGRIRLSGGETDLREPAPRNHGTTITVRDLFFNTPARRKYLASAAAEKRAVVTLVTTMALAHPKVRWQLLADRQSLLDYRPVDSLPERAHDVLGAAVMEHMARFAAREGGLTVNGLASRPTWTRGNRSQQFIYVNRRAINSPSLSQAIFQAYREVVPRGRHPVVLLFLEIPAGEVDVNVHPAKSEVRLLLERRVFTLVRSALQEGLNLRAVGLADEAASVPAAAGATVVKHGNRSVSSKSGSADMLEELGMPMPLDAAAAIDTLNALNFTFLFAPAYHPAMKAIMPVRIAMGVRTVFNILGPLANPAGPARLVVGAFDVDTARLMADALSGMPIERAFVIHGEPGWDEATPVGEFILFDVTPGSVKETRRTPEDYGVSRCRPEDLKGGDGACNAAALVRVMTGADSGPHRDALLMGTSLVLEVAGIVDSAKDGVLRVADTIDSGAAGTFLENLKRHFAG